MPIEIKPLAACYGFMIYDDGNVDQVVKEMNIKSKTNTKKIYSIDTNGVVVHYQSAAEAHRETGINNIHRSLKNGTPAGGRIWFYEE